VGRDTLRAPAAFELNVRYSRQLRLSEGYRLELPAEATNVTNTSNIIGVNSTALADVYGGTLIPASGAATAARDQRLIQLSIRFAF
jgi:hypothetical protein